MSDYDGMGLAPSNDDFEEMGQRNGDSGVPREETTEKTRMLEGEEDLGPTTVRSNRAGTTSDVYVHDGATHVGCKSSTKETMESPVSRKGIKDDYPWYYTHNNLKHKNADVWRHAQQSYVIAKELITDTESTTQQPDHEKSKEKPKSINCFVRGSTSGRSKQRKVVLEDEDSDEEGNQMVCSMTGQTWESLPFPIVINSGACASVMPSGWCRHVPLQKTCQSESGEYFRAANGTKIFNEGQRSVSMMTREGAWRDMNFTVCNVAKALGSVSQMCRAGHSVIFNLPMA